MKNLSSSYKCALPLMCSEIGSRLHLFTLAAVDIPYIFNAAREVDFDEASIVSQKFSCQIMKIRSYHYVTI
jgi:hypothetical protein